MPDVIPQADADFNQFMQVFVPYVGGHAVNLGLTAPQATALNSVYTDWSDAYGAKRDAELAAEAATATKESAKAALMTLAREFINIIQTHPGITDDVRQLMGLPIPDTTRTRAPVPTTKPVVTVDTRQHLQHVVHWRDESKPKSKAKPKGVRGAVIRVFVGPTPPADPKEFEWVALDSATPYLLVHDAGDAGKLAHYALCWENTHSEDGPWSDVITATITA
jgi:hypothetical protein